MSVEDMTMLLEYLSANNSLLVRLIQDVDLLISIILVLVLSYLYYSYLRYFTRF